MTVTLHAPVDPVLPLVSADALAALATLQPVPSVAWVIGTDLRFQAAGGPLLPLVADIVGRHLYEIRGTDSLSDPSIAAVHRALQGERVPYVTYGRHHWWQCRAVPIHGGGVVRGVLGVVALLTEQEECVGPAPCHFDITDSDTQTGTEVGDQLVVIPGPEGGARIVRPVHPDVVTRLMMLGHLRPLRHGADDRVSPPGPMAAVPIPPARPLRPGPVRVRSR